MRVMISLFFYLGLSFSALAECKKNVGALDFGSGTTKALVVEVDFCQKKINKVVFEERVATAFNEALEKSLDQTLPMDFVKEQFPRFQQLITQLKQHDVQSLYAVATAVYRTAKNGSTVVAEMSKALSVPIEIISQEREAELGYWSALAAKNLQAQEKVIVWDIGGGSMQMYAKNGEKTEIFKGDLASVSFKNRVLAEVQKKDIKVVNSPNPLLKSSKAAVALSLDHAQKNVPEFFRTRGTHYRWIGVGGVLAMSVQGQVQAEAQVFSKQHLEKTLRHRAKLKDEQIQSEYRATDVTNLALVLGYMRALKIEKIETAQVTLGQGLIYEDLHQKK